MFFLGSRSACPEMGLFSWVPDRHVLRWIFLFWVPDRHVLRWGFLFWVPDRHVLRWGFLFWVPDQHVLRWGFLFWVPDQILLRLLSREIRALCVQASRELYLVMAKSLHLAKGE